MLRGLMPRYVALLFVNRLKRNIFLVNVPLKWLPTEAFSAPKCTKYRLAGGLHPDPLGKLTALPDPQLDLRGVLLREGEGKRGRKGWGNEGRDE